VSDGRSSWPPPIPERRLRPVPNWRGLIHDIWFTWKQPKGHITVSLHGVGYELVRHANETEMCFRFTRSVK
jgi:hypothetical protein